MYCNFLLMSVNVCREWLGNVDIDWKRVNNKSNVDLECDEDDFSGHSIKVTVYYEDGKPGEENHHVCKTNIVCSVSGNFGVDGIPLQKFVDIIKKTPEKMLLLCTEYEGHGKVVAYEFKPSARHQLLDTNKN